VNPLHADTKVAPAVVKDDHKVKKKKRAEKKDFGTAKFLAAGPSTGLPVPILHSPVPQTEEEEEDYNDEDGEL
jgi:hypothetical protein